LRVRTVTGVTAPPERLCYRKKNERALGGRAMASLMLSWGIRFAALGWLALRFCAAVVLGLAIVGAAIVVWAIAGLVIAVIGDEPPKHCKARYEGLSTR
jgi:hypothetical protein